MPLNVCSRIDKKLEAKAFVMFTHQMCEVYGGFKNASLGDGFTISELLLDHLLCANESDT